MRKFAVFDIDGTLIRWQLYHTLVDTLAKEGALGSEAFEDFNAARMRWKRREGRDAFREYELLLVTTFEKMLNSIDPRDLDRLVRGVIDEYKDQTYRYTRKLLLDLKSKNYFLIAISGSHHELVAEMAAYYDFDDYVGSKYERRNGKFTGKKTIASKAKQDLLKKMIQKHDLSLKGSVAIGESRSDAGMLELVDLPIAFNPDQNLFTIASQHKWKIVIERKNMIYHLENIDGTYHLAETN